VGHGLTRVVADTIAKHLITVNHSLPMPHALYRLFST